MVIRATRQRKILGETVESWQGAFTVAELHERARAQEPGLGLATTYRTGELLREAGTIRPLAGSEPE